MVAGGESPPRPKGRGLLAQRRDKTSIEHTNGQALSPEVTGINRLPIFAQRIAVRLGIPYRYSYAAPSTMAGSDTGVWGSLLCPAQS